MMIRLEELKTPISIAPKIKRCRRIQIITSIAIVMILIILIVVKKNAPKEYRVIVGVSGGVFILAINVFGYLYVRSLKNSSSQILPKPDHSIKEKKKEQSANNEEINIAQQRPPDGQEKQSKSPDEIESKTTPEERVQQPTAGNQVLQEQSKQNFKTEEQHLPATAVTALEIPSSNEKAPPKICEDLIQFFQFLKPHEREDLLTLHHPSQDIVIQSIEKSDWSALLILFNEMNNEDLFYKILDSIFIQGRNNNIDDLVMAYMVIANRVPNSNDCKIISYQEVKDSKIWEDLDKRLINIEGVPPNQLFFFEVNSKLMSMEQFRFISALFYRPQKNNVIGAFRNKNNPWNPSRNDRFLIASPSLMRKDALLIGSLRFMYKMPKPSKVCKYLLKYEHVVSVMHPKDELKIMVHTVHPVGLLSFLHDLYHTAVRSCDNLFEDMGLLHTGDAIGILLEQIPPYSKDGYGRDENKEIFLTQFATRDDFARLCLENTLQKIIDGESIKGFKATAAQQLESILESVTKRIYKNAKVHSEEFQAQGLQVLIEHFHALGFEISYCNTNFIVNEVAAS